jgi:uncharacterized protein YbjT (DUF2867 family)
MATQYDNVIIFGPTGATGSAAAAEAAKRGAKVWLAMRDVNKPIKSLDESSGHFERIQADLSDSASVKTAIETSKAKAAYLYQVHAKDAMRATVAALKEGGVEYVVLLSSFTIFPEEKARDVPPEKIIPYFHASVEATIEDAGLAGTFLRPGAFAYNTFNQNVNRQVTPWKALIPKALPLSDGIVPRDIGRVGGAVLVDRPSTEKTHIIYLYGPKLLTREQHLQIATQVTGIEIDIEKVVGETYIQSMVKNGIPEFVARYLVKADDGHLNEKYYGDGKHEEGVANVEKYSGTRATTFEEFVKEYLQ